MKMHSQNKTAILFVVLSLFFVSCGSSPEEPSNKDPVLNSTNESASGKIKSPQAKEECKNLGLNSITHEPTSFEAIEQAFIQGLMLAQKTGVDRQRFRTLYSQCL